MKEWQRTKEEESKKGREEGRRREGERGSWAPARGSTTEGGPVLHHFPPSAFLPSSLPPSSPPLVASLHPLFPPIYLLLHLLLSLEWCTKNADLPRENNHSKTCDARGENKRGQSSTCEIQVARIPGRELRLTYSNRRIQWRTKRGKNSIYFDNLILEK